MSFIDVNLYTTEDSPKNLTNLNKTFIKVDLQRDVTLNENEPDKITTTQASDLMPKRTITASTFSISTTPYKEIRMFQSLLKKLKLRQQKRTRKINSKLISIKHNGSWVNKSFNFPFQTLQKKLNVLKIYFTAGAFVGLIFATVVMYGYSFYKTRTESGYQNV